MATSGNRTQSAPGPDEATAKRKAADEVRKQSLAANEELLKLNHRIRELEQHIKTATRRRYFAAWSYLLGPVLLLLLYTLPWLDLLPGRAVVAIYVPAIPLALYFFVVAVRNTRDPGGPRVPHTEGESRRQTESQLELSLARTRDIRKLKVAQGTYDATTRRLIYKEDAYSDIERLRIESKRYRNVNNFLQGVLIIGALGATGSSAIAAELQALRWVTFGLSFTVGIASGFMGYFKYKERSFYLQQTADAIEHEWEAFEVGIGRYKHTKDKNEEQALADFVEEVHRLKSEQRKRQQTSNNLRNCAATRKADSRRLPCPARSPNGAYGSSDGQYPTAHDQRASVATGAPTMRNGILVRRQVASVLGEVDSLWTTLRHPM